MYKATDQTPDELAWLGFFTEARRLAVLARARRAEKLTAAEAVDLPGHSPD